MSFKVKFSILCAIFFWASAFVAIRAGLLDFSPGGLALIRYLIASFFMLFIYFYCQKKRPLNPYYFILALANGIIGIGIYNIALNYGEISIPSGMASFIVSQSPIISMFFAVILLDEKITKFFVLGMFVSAFGVTMIALSNTNDFNFYLGIFYILIATIVGSLYSIFQKFLLRHFNVIELTTYAIWGGTLILLLFIPSLIQDLQKVSMSGIAIACYLGIFPSVAGYLAWSYVLSQISAARAVSFLFFTPIAATIVGWIWLNEIPTVSAFIGGLIALFGVWLANKSFFVRAYKEI